MEKSDGYSGYFQYCILSSATQGSGNQNWTHVWELD